MLKNLITKNRSYRRFNESKTISEQTLTELVELARLSASGRNLQPLKYLLSADKKMNEIIFPHLAWAGSIKDWDGPIEGERPSAYLVQLGDLRLTKNFGQDPGITAQSILLGAVEKGLGGCMIGSIKKQDLHAALELPDHFEITMVIALGEPVEKVVLYPIKNDDVKYWRDEDAVHHVPKRSLDDLIVNPSR